MFGLQVGADGLGDGVEAVTLEQVQQALVDAPCDAGALVDEAGVQLDEAGAVAYLLVGAAGVGDAADADDGHVGALGDEADGACRPVLDGVPGEAARLVGDPIEDRATDTVRFVAERTDVPVVGVGGVSDADGAYEKIRNGACLVQLYTGLVYEGPGVAKRINEGLLDLLERDGFDSVAEAVGADL